MEPLERLLDSDSKSDVTVYPRLHNGPDCWETRQDFRPPWNLVLTLDRNWLDSTRLTAVSEVQIRKSPRWVS